MLCRRKFTLAMCHPIADLSKIWLKWDKKWPEIKRPKILASKLAGFITYTSQASMPLWENNFFVSFLLGRGKWGRWWGRSQCCWWKNRKKHETRERYTARRQQNTRTENRWNERKTKRHWTALVLTSLMRNGRKAVAWKNTTFFIKASLIIKY